jgi:predicted nucleic acid-binding Zn ribbon protein
MGTAYNIYKHEAKDYTTFRLILYGIFFVVILITMILTVASNPF